MHILELDENKIEQVEGMSVDYPYCMHKRNLTDIVIPWHWHEELELGYLEKGTSIITTANAEYTCSSGGWIFYQYKCYGHKKKCCSQMYSSGN